MRLRRFNDGDGQSFAAFQQTRGSRDAGGATADDDDIEAVVSAVRARCFVSCRRVARVRLQGASIEAFV
jgi:hypothetical protein